MNKDKALDIINYGKVMQRKANACYGASEFSLLSQFFSSCRTSSLS